MCSCQTQVHAMSQEVSELSQLISKLLASERSYIVTLTVKLATTIKRQYKKLHINLIII